MNSISDETDVCQDELIELERNDSLEAFEHSNIIISLKVYGRMMALIEKETDGPAFPDAWALYSHYFYTGRRQATNQPFATASYCKQWFGWGTEKFHRSKNFLVKHGFIEDVIKRDENQKITGHYIKVPGMSRSHPTQKPEGGFSPRVAEQQTNALKQKHLNALNQNNNVPVAENELAAKEKNEIPHAYIMKYGIERIDEVRRNTPAGAFNPVGWQIKALDGDYGHDPKAPPGWIPGDKMPTVNGPGVFWLEGSNVDVLYHGKHYHEEHKDGEVWYVPVEEYANSNAG